MRAMNLDTLVSTGQRPWRPTAAADDVEVWNKFDFPTSGTFRLGDDMVVFTLITTAGSQSLWAYVPVAAGDQKSVTDARFDSDAEFDAFVATCFAGREAVFAVAQDHFITAKSDGVPIGDGEHALLTAAAQWYMTRYSARMRLPALRVETSDADDLLLTTQGVLASCG
jgi:hypothetical protein